MDTRLIKGLKIISDPYGIQIRSIRNENLGVLALYSNFQLLKQKAAKPIGVEFLAGDCQQANRAPRYCHHDHYRTNHWLWSALYSDCMMNGTEHA
jgi:hypothetical protein